MNRQASSVFPFFIASIIISCSFTDAGSMNDFQGFNEIYAKYFVSKPARSCVAVKALPLGVLCLQSFITICTMRTK
jgi:enamine deaminase RidA (YjgF/YER057c/UK114 family)